MPTYEAETEVPAFDRYGFMTRRKGHSRIDATNHIEARKLIREGLIINGVNNFKIGVLRRVR